MVDSENILVLNNRFDRVKYECIGPEVGQWNRLQQPLGNGAEVGSRDDAIRPERAIGSSCRLRHAAAVLQRNRRDVRTKWTPRGAPGKISVPLCRREYRRIAAVF